MKKVISNGDLNEFLKDLIDNIKPHSTEMREVFEVLFKTGLRSEEVINLSRWAIDSNGIYVVRTCKHSALRMIKSIDLGVEFEAQLIKDTGRYCLIDYGSVAYFFRKCLKGYRFFVGNKGIDLHLFRYNFIRQLHEKGKMFSEIVSIMGHKEEVNTANYLMNNIYYE